jgi:hypothetical protein
VTMNRWAAPGSVFAPVIAAVPPGTEWCGFGNALIAMADCVPHAMHAYRVKRPGTLRRITEVRERMLLTVTGQDAAPFSVRALLIDKPPGRKAEHLAAIRMWELGMTRLKDGLCGPAIPDDFDSAILQVSKFQISKLGLAGAPQLALLRHLWAQAVLAASPDAIVFGGQHDWQDAWWTEQIARDELTAQEEEARC